MRKIVASAALAVTMACGLCGGAEAAIVHASGGGGGTPNDGGLNFDVTFNTNSGTGYGTYFEYGQEGNFIDQYAFQLTSNNVVGSILPVAGCSQPYCVGYDVSITFKDFTTSPVDGYLFDNVPSAPFVITAHEEHDIFGDGYIEYDIISTSDGEITGGGFANVDVTLSAIPLPASAPLFGGALLALGVVGYARRCSVHRADAVQNRAWTAEVVERQGWGPPKRLYSRDG